LVNQIKGTAAITPTPVAAFNVLERGGVSLTTPGGTSGQPVSGYAQIKANAGSTTPSGLAILGYRPNNVLVSEASVPAMPLIQSGRIYAEVDDRVNTGLAIANPNNQSATISFYFTGPAGNFGGGTITIASNGEKTAFLSEDPFNSGSLPLGTFTFTSTMPVAVVALRGFTNERGEFLMTTLPVADLSVTLQAGQSLYAPHYTDGAGWITQMVLVNPTDTALTGSVLFKNPSGDTVTTTPYSIAPRMSQKIATAGASASLQSGYVIVLPATGAVSPVALTIFSFRRDGTTVTETGVPAMNAASAYRLYGETSGDFGHQAPGSVGTGLAVVNRSNAAVRMTVELTRLDGSSTGLSGAIDVPAAGQVAKFLNQIPGLEALPLPFKGIVRVSSPSALSVIGLRGRYNERNDFLITTTLPVNETVAATTSDLYFPHFANAGGFSTQFILFSGSAGQQSSGSLRLFSQSGSPLTLTLR
jgi:hypothetical protein